MSQIQNSIEQISQKLQQVEKLRLELIQVISEVDGLWEQFNQEARGYALSEQVEYNRAFIEVLAANIQAWDFSSRVTSGEDVSL